MRWIIPQKATNYIAFIAGVIHGIGVTIWGRVEKSPEISENLEAILLTILGVFMIVIFLYYVLGKGFMRTSS